MSTYDRCVDWSLAVGFAGVLLAAIALTWQAVTFN